MWAARVSLLVALFLGLSVFCVAEKEFPAPPLPHAPQGFNIMCDVCHTMLNRIVPYCEREDENMDYLPDFCTYNYNKVLRTECDYIAEVAEYVWCPNPCDEVRKFQSFAAEKLCSHPLVNCTDRSVPVQLPTPSPSPSPSAAPPDCVLCEYVLRHTALMCMNRETANQRNIYHVCMEKTKSKTEFENCMMILHELVDLAGTEDPCELLTCETNVTCFREPDDVCHVVRQEGNLTKLFEGEASVGVAYNPTVGLGPGDFRPGQAPYHSLVPRRTRLPPNVSPGHFRYARQPTAATDAEGIAAEEEAARETAAQENDLVAAEPEPTPVPLKEIKMQ